MFSSHGGVFSFVTWWEIGRLGSRYAIGKPASEVAARIAGWMTSVGTDTVAGIALASRAAVMNALVYEAGARAVGQEGDLPGVGGSGR
jgi:hypothetical protein